MPWSFWTSYLLKLAVLAVTLAALYAAAQGVCRLRLFGSRADRRVSVIETLALSQSSAIYLLRVGTRYFLVGASGAAIATLAELEPGELTRGADYTLK